MQIWACTPGQGDAAQHFTLTSASQIQWANTAECLDLTNGVLTSGNQVRIPFLITELCLIVLFSSTGPDVGMRNGQHEPNVEAQLIFSTHRAF
jgi:hypothetical protein